jgi:hypothetical protein
LPRATPRFDSADRNTYAVTTRRITMSRGRLLLVFAALLCVTFVGGCFLFSNRPPEASFIVRYDVDPGDPLVVELDASSSTDPENDSIVYYWNFGENVTILTPLEYTKYVEIPVIRVRYPLEGTYTLSLHVRDELNLSEKAVKTITVPNVPVGPTD